MTMKELDKRTLITREIAANIKKVSTSVQKPRVLAFIDDRYCSVIDLARVMIKEGSEDSE